jgi:hypothetical protein
MLDWIWNGIWIDRKERKEPFGCGKGRRQAKGREDHWQTKMDDGKRWKEGRESKRK